METVLNTIIDNAHLSARQGLPHYNPYQEGTLRHLAYEIGFDNHSTGVVATRSDGQVFAVCEVEPGEYQSVVPSDLAEMSAMHGSIEDAAIYVRDLAADHGLACELLAA